MSGDDLVTIYRCVFQFYKTKKTSTKDLMFIMKFSRDEMLILKGNYETDCEFLIPGVVQLQ